jgi:hypothetical protein
VGPSQHLRQIRAERAARIVVAARLLAGAIRGNVRGEGKQLFVSAVTHDQVSKPVLARASALGALDAQHIELADQLGENDGAFSGLSFSLLFFEAQNIRYQIVRLRSSDVEIWHVLMVRLKEHSE